MTWKSPLIFEVISDIQLSTYLLLNKSTSSSISKMWSAFCAFNIGREIVEIWTKFFISWAILDIPGLEVFFDYYL